MTKRSIPGLGKTRSQGLGVIERDDLYGSQFRGLHQGQRSRAPRSKAGHMTAPTMSSSLPKSSCHAGAVHT